MHPQLQQIIDEFHGATERLNALVDGLPEENWKLRAHPDRWSVAECVAHLNLTGEAFLPPLRQALASGPGGSAPARYRRDPLGWFLWRMMKPPVRLRVPSAPMFIPQALAPMKDVLADFHCMQSQLIAVVESGDGAPLQRLRIRSPFDQRASYNVFAAFGILARHEHRHLLQAEKVKKDL
jgi:hypothetical protein